MAAWVSWKSFGHVQSRVTTWLDPWKDPNGDSFQVVQGWFAMANGGLTGTGLGLGNQLRIPYIESDFIFVAVAQELGLFGATLVLVAYLLLFGSGLRIAARAEHAFDKLLAVGLTTLLGVQAFIIIGGIVRVLPLTGVTLPFIVLRRLVARLELDRARPAAADLRREPPPGRREDGDGDRVNTQIRRLGVAIIACYIALFVMLNWIQVVAQGPARQQHATTRSA